MCVRACVRVCVCVCVCVCIYMYVSCGVECVERRWSSFKCGRSLFDVGIRETDTYVKVGKGHILMPGCMHHKYTSKHNNCTNKSTITSY